MKDIGEKIKSLNNKIENLLDAVSRWLEETEPKEEGHDTV